MYSGDLVALFFSFIFIERVYVFVFKLKMVELVKLFVSSFGCIMVSLVDFFFPHHLFTFILVCLLCVFCCFTSYKSQHTEEKIIKYIHTFSWFYYIVEWMVCTLHEINHVYEFFYLSIFLLLLFLAFVESISFGLKPDQHIKLHTYSLSHTHSCWCFEFGVIDIYI